MTAAPARPTPGPAAIASIARRDVSQTRVDIKRNDYFQQSPWTAEVRVHASSPGEALVALDAAYDLAVAQLQAAAENEAQGGARG